MLYCPVKSLTFKRNGLQKTDGHTCDLTVSQTSPGFYVSAVQVF